MQRLSITMKNLHQNIWFPTLDLKLKPQEYLIEVLSLDAEIYLSFGVVTALWISVGDAGSNFASVYMKRVHSKQSDYYFFI